MTKWSSICFCLLMIVACHNPSMPKSATGEVMKLENVMYFNNRSFGDVTVFVWDSIVLEQRKTTAVYNIAKPDATGKIRVTSSSSKTHLSGYFLVDLHKNIYFQFNEVDSLISNGKLSSKLEGIKYDWDIINESSGNIYDFIPQKDTIISGENYSKLIRKEKKDIYANTYEILLNKKATMNFSFRPVSVELSKKYMGFITHYNILNSTKGITFKGTWEIQGKLNQSELTKVRHYQAWYRNFCASN